MVNGVSPVYYTTSRYHSYLNDIGIQKFKTKYRKDRYYMALIVKKPKGTEDIVPSKVYKWHTVRR